MENSHLLKLKFFDTEKLLSANGRSGPSNLNFEEFWVDKTMEKLMWIC